MALNKSDYHSDQILDQIGRKLPKKLRKKVRWKKIAPLLQMFITLFATFTNTSTVTRHSRPELAENRQTSSVKPGRRSASSGKLADDALRRYVERAKAYQLEIEQLAQNATGAANQKQLQDLATHLHAWTGAVATLAQRIDDFRQNRLVGQDIQEVPTSIASLNTRLQSETDPTLRVELERTLANRRQQWAALETLQRNSKMAEIKLENTLSMLGTIYSQILVGQTTTQVAGYRRLLAQIDDEVLALQDHLEALEEVKMGRI
jgi:hypothetical protein